MLYLLMKVGESSQLLEGFSFTNDDMVKVTPFTFFVLMQKHTTIIGTVTAFIDVCLLDVKNCATTYANTPWCLQGMQLASAHPVDA